MYHYLERFRLVQRYAPAEMMVHRLWMLIQHHLQQLLFQRLLKS